MTGICRGCVKRRALGNLAVKAMDSEGNGRRQIFWRREGEERMGKITIIFLVILKLLSCSSSLAVVASLCYTILGCVLFNNFRNLIERN